MKASGREVGAPGGAREPRTAVSLAALAGIAIGVVVLGVAVNVWRPLAPDVGAAPMPTRWFSASLLERIADYHRPLRVIGVVASVVAAVGPLLLVAWWSRRRPPRKAGIRAIPLRAGLIAVAVVAVQDALLLPFRFWAGFVHAGAFGLRTQGLAGWTGDLLLAMAPRWVGAAFVVALVVWLVQRLPRRWPLALGVGLAVSSGVVVVAWPLVIEPLRFDFTSLPPGPTRTAVEEVVDAGGLDGTPILVADASRRTTVRNAYVSGVAGTRRIVLYDTLLELPDEEVTAVVAHEVAHALHRDVVRGWAAAAAATVLGCAAAGLVVVVWRRRGGIAPAALLRRPGAVALLVATALFVEAAAVPAVAWYSRRVEAAADATALELTGDGDAFVGLQRSLVEANLSDPAPPAWWVWWRATHPPSAERLHRAASLP